MLATAEVSSGAASASFHIPVPATLNSDGSAQKVTIARLEMPAKLRYLAAPALRENRLPGGGNPQRQRLPAAPRHPEYLSRQQLRRQRPSARGDARRELRTGTGRRRGHRHRTQAGQRYTDSSGLIGNRTRVNYEFRIDVRNNHKNAERVQFEDQLPVSRNEQIQVTLLEPKAQEVKARTTAS
ncbi:mucoidy inhibitor MuiA family protein [Pseudomonas aeruginosa]|nr:mucoidy inhibitor MuiA family protein [Pseudomonas aeruginosa]